VTHGVEITESDIDICGKHSVFGHIQPNSV
jgi:hypothetical protein